MTLHRPTLFTRRRLLAAAVAVGCGWAALPMTRVLAAMGHATPRGPVRLPLAAANLYALHDLAG